MWRIAVVEDEISSQEKLKEFILRYGNENNCDFNVSCFKDGISFLNNYKSNYDIVFMDIEMPYLSGLELLASLAHPPHVIITSAYEQYALKGYELDVTDYLLKPISFDRFLKAVNKVHGLLQQEKWPDEANNFIFVRSDRQMHKVLFKDILVVEGLENYVCIYTESTKLLVRSTMKRMIEALPGGVFQQVHKSYLINLEKIEMIDGNRIIVGRHTVPVARNFREEVFARILKNTL